MIEPKNLALVELILGWFFVFWIMVTTIITQKNLRASKSIKHSDLVRGLHKQTIAFGFSLIALAELTTIAALYYPKTLGILVFAINVPVFYLAHRARKELERPDTVVKKKK